MTAPGWESLPEPPDVALEPVGTPPPVDPALAAELATLSRELIDQDGTRLARATRLVAFVIVAMAASISATGVLALIVGLWAWHRPLPVGLIIMVLVAPAIMGPMLVARHALLLGRAAGQPRALVAEAQDLVTGLRASPELRTLASSLVRRRRPATPGAPGAGKPRRRGLRNALSTTRLLTTVVGLAGPDKARHPLLMGFTPVRMRTTWLAFWWSLWGWLVAILVLLGATARLLVG